MRVNLDWLSDWVELGGRSADAHRSRSHGLGARGRFDRGVMAPDSTASSSPRCLRVDRHPNADRLSVCVVDDGAGQHQVVCGAPNVAAGIKAPFARVGAKLPNGKAIGAAELRGVQSNGMLCSAKELELVDDVNGLLMLDADAPQGRCRSPTICASTTRCSRST